MRSWIPIALFLSVALPAVAFAGELEERFLAQPGGALRIDMASGFVEVIVHELDEIRIEAVARGVGAGGVRFHTRTAGDDVLLAAVAEPWLDLLQSGPGIRVRVWAPSGFRVAVSDGVTLAGPSIARGRVPLEAPPAR